MFDRLCRAGATLLRRFSADFKAFRLKGWEDGEAFYTSPTPGAILAFQQHTFHTYVFHPRLLETRSKTYVRYAWNIRWNGSVSLSRIRPDHL